MSPLPDNNTLEDETTDSNILERTGTLDPSDSLPCSAPTSKPTTRPRRTIRLPSRYQDFEM